MFWYTHTVFWYKFLYHWPLNACYNLLLQFLGFSPGKDREEGKPERESWMLELPANKKTFGMFQYSITAHLQK